MIRGSRVEGLGSVEGLESRVECRGLSADRPGAKVQGRGVRGQEPLVSEGLGSRVEGPGVLGRGLRVLDLGFRPGSGRGSRVEDLGARFYGPGAPVDGLGSSHISPGELNSPEGLGRKSGGSRVNLGSRIEVAGSSVQGVWSGMWDLGGSV
eukprot:3681558-Rhodomonas_salina.1